MTIILLAAGYATRLYPLTRDTPKALLDIGGAPILDHICERVRRIPGAQRIVVITNARFHGHFMAWRRTHPDWDIDLLNDGTASDEDKLGALGDIDFALQELAIDDDLFIMAGDNLVSFELTPFVDYCRAKQACGVVVRQSEPDFLRRAGVVQVDAAMRILQFEEKPAHPKSDLAAFAIYYYTRATLPLLRRYLDEGGNRDAPGHFPAWLCSRAPVYAWPCPGDCIDIGTPATYARARQEYSRFV